MQSSHQNYSQPRQADQLYQFNCKAADETKTILSNFREFDQLADDIKKNGYKILENAIHPSVIDEILADSTIAVPRINANDLGPVFLGNLRFTTNAIASSKSVYDIITSDFVLSLCKAYFLNRFHLVNNRVQSTYRYVDMPWHTDNNLLKDGRHVGRHELPGLQFIIYLTDIHESPFQLIRGSQDWSAMYNGHYLTTSEADHHQHKQVSLTPPRGSILILNTHTFHRAAPICNPAYHRAILLFQVDEISDQLPGHGEKLLINPEFLVNFNDELASFLGFGRQRNYPAFPETSAATIGAKENLSVEWQLMRQLFPSLLKQLAKTLLPHNFIVSVKNRSLSPKRTSRSS